MPTDEKLDLEAIEARAKRFESEIVQLRRPYQAWDFFPMLISAADDRIALIEEVKQLRYELGKAQGIDPCVDLA